LERRFRLGEFNGDRPLVDLLEFGLEETDALELIEVWKCRREAIGKKIPAAKLCKLYSEGLLSHVEYYDRLRTLGWDHDSSVILIASCEVGITKKTQQEEAKNERERQRQIKERQRELQQKARNTERAEANRKRIETEIARANSSAAAARASKQKKDYRRQRLLTTAASDIFKRSGEDLGDLTVAIKSAIKSVARSQQITLDLSYELAAIAANLPTAVDYPTFALLYAQLASAVDEADRQAIIDANQGT